LLLTPLRRSLLRPWLYVGALVALVLFAPSAYWQAVHGWPFVAIMRVDLAGESLALTPLAFIRQQVAFVGPLAAPIWIAGLWRLSVRPPLPAVRVFPIAYAVMAPTVFAMHGKAYYLTSIYPMLLAGGALTVDGWVAVAGYRWAAVGAVAVGGVLTASLVLPILPPATMQRTPARSERRPSRQRLRRAPRVCCLSTWPTCSAGARWRNT